MVSQHIMYSLVSPFFPVSIYYLQLTNLGPISMSIFFTPPMLQTSDFQRQYRQLHYDSSTNNCIIVPRKARSEDKQGVLLESPVITISVKELQHRYGVFLPGLVPGTFINTYILALICIEQCPSKIFLTLTQMQLDPFLFIIIYTVESKSSSSCMQIAFSSQIPQTG